MTADELCRHAGLRRAGPISTARLISASPSLLPRLVTAPELRSPSADGASPPLELDKRTNVEHILAVASRP